MDGPDGHQLKQVLQGLFGEAANDLEYGQNTVAIHTDDDKAYLLKEKMTDMQLADYKAHPDSYFGKVKYVPKGIKTPYDLFLFFVEGQKEMERAKLLEHLQMNEAQAGGSSDEDLLLELCERQISGSGMFEVVKGVLTNNPNPQGASAI